LRKKVVLLPPSVPSPRSPPLFGHRSRLFLKRAARFRVRRSTYSLLCTLPGFSPASTFFLFLHYVSSRLLPEAVCGCRSASLGLLALIFLQLDHPLPVYRGNCGQNQSASRGSPASFRSLGRLGLPWPRRYRAGDRAKVHFDGPLPPIVGFAQVLVVPDRTTLPEGGHSNPPLQTVQASRPPLPCTRDFLLPAGM